MAVLAVLCLLIGVGAARAAVHSYEATLDGIQPVPPSGSPATGTGLFMIDDVANTVTYTITYSGLLGAEIAGHILAGLTYINIHTTMFPGGEIRGQVTAAEPAGCRLNCPALDGGVVNLDETGNHSPDLDGSGDVSVTDFAIFAGHFLHGVGPAGVCE